MNQSNFPSPSDAELLGLLMDAIPDRIYFKDRQSRIVRNNAAHARALGATAPEACVGKSDADFFTPEHAADARADEERIMRTGEPLISKVERITMRDGRQGWASTTKLPWRNAAGEIIGTYGLTRDVTEAKQAEEKLLEERNLLRTIIDHLPSRLYVKDTAARYVMNNLAHLRVLGVDAQAATVGRTVLEFFPGERGAQAMADDQQVLGGGPSILNQEKSDFGSEGSIHWSLVTKVPLHDTHGRLTGLVGISHDITRRKLAEEEIRRRTAEMEADVRMARQVQEAFLSRPLPVFPPDAAPGSPTLHFAHRYLPTSTLGGDFFDLIAVGPDKCGVLICDVMGHGVRAGLLTALVRGVVGEVGRHTDDPAAVLAELNRSLMPVVEQTGQPVFATAFYGVIDLTRKRLTYANAGHPPPLIARTGSPEIKRLTPDDPEPATGLLADFTYSHLECEFAPGDLLLGFTDGITEAADAAGHLFGEDHVRGLLAGRSRMDAEEVCRDLMASVGAHHGAQAFDDDVCVVAVGFTAGA